MAHVDTLTSILIVAIESLEKRLNRALILAVGDELPFVLDARIGALLPQEVRAKHFLALGAISDAYP